MAEFFEPSATYYKIPQPMSFIHRSRQGVTRSDLNQFSRDSKRAVLDLAEILPSSYSTLTKKEVFDKATSQHILLLQDLFTFGTDVFGDVRQFNQWLDTEVVYLGGATPFSLLDTTFGIELIKKELYKIDLGLPV